MAVEENALKAQVTGIKPGSNYRWWSMILVCTAIAISYIDRVNLGVAAPTLMKEFGLTPADMGVLLSAFFWSYVLCMMPIGILLNRIGSKMIMFFSCLGWGLVTMATAFVAGYWSLFAIRVLLGATESSSFPTSARVVSVWIPKEERTLASAAFDSAARVGSAFTPPLIVWVIINYSWQLSFAVTGFLAVLFSFVWLKHYHEPENHPKVTQSELEYIRQSQVVEPNETSVKPKMIPIVKLFTYRRINLMCLGFFMYIYFWTTFNLWVPSYLVQAKGFDLKAMGFAAMYPYIAGLVMELIGAWLFDCWVRSGATLNKVRRTAMGVGMGLAAVSIYFTVYATDPNMIIFWLCSAMGWCSVGAASVWAITVDIAPAGQVGSVASTQGAIGNLGSVLSPLVTGFMANSIWGYKGAFLVLCLSAVLSALAYVLNEYNQPVVPR